MPAPRESLDALLRDLQRALHAGDDEAARRINLAMAALLGALSGTNQPATVGEMGPAEQALHIRPPSVRTLATMLGCTHGFLSQCRAGKSRIRRSWALQIAAVRPSWPATRKTWPAGWADEPDDED